MAFRSAARIARQAAGVIARNTPRPQSQARPRIRKMDCPLAERNLQRSSCGALPGSGRMKASLERAVIIALELWHPYQGEGPGNDSFYLRPLQTSDRFGVGNAVCGANGS